MASSRLFNGKDLSGWYGWGTRDPSELWAMTPEQQAEYKKQSIEGGAVDEKGKPADDHVNAHWKVENGELVNDGKGLVPHDRQGLRRLRAHGRIQGAARWRQRHLPARHSAGADLG